jgi:hypothetical protein
MRDEIIRIMGFWEVVLDDNKEVLGRYNQEYFSEAKIGEIVKKLYEQQIKQGHDLSIRLSKD